MSDQTPAQSAEAPAPSPAAGTAPATKTQTTIPEMESCELITATHVPGGHAFVVTTVETERTTITTTETRTSEEKEVFPPSGDCLKAVPIMTPTKSTQPEDGPSCSRSGPLSDSKSVVPLSSSLPSKLLRFHAKRSAQALLHQVEQSQSLDSQFGSDESGAAGGGAGSGYSSESTAHECEMPRPSAPALTPRSTPVEGYDDVGMGSSIEDSEESEEDDELKPLAVDNHMFHDVDLGSPRAHQNSPQDELDAAASTSAAVLSEANLEKFHKHQQNPFHMDNIYLHPNFKYQLEQKESPEVSPPPPVAPVSSPTEQKRVHRSFLTMKKSIAVETQAVEKAGSVCSNKAETNSDMGVVNEIDSLEAELVPSEELAQEIADAVEFYFSNESILKDAFLLKHVRRNKEGFVSLKLVSSFKRVRQLTKEWKVVGNAVRRKSRKIELNDVGTKVRRIDPLPNFDETMPSRTIVACDLPMDKLTIEKVSDIFSKCGEIALIRILKPGMAIPVDVRQFMNKYPEMQQKECALVEYLESSSAREAKDLEGPFQVFDMVAPKKKTGKKALIQIAAPVQRMVENYRYYNDATYERTRGGSFSGVMPHTPPEDLRFRLKRNNSEIPVKSVMDFNASHHHQPSYYHQTSNPHHHHHQHHHYQPHTHYTQQPPMHRGSFAADHQYHHYQARNSISQEAIAGSPVSSPSLGTGGQPNFFAYSPRRYSNTSTISANTAAALADTPSSSAAVAVAAGSPNSGGGLQRRLSNSSDNNYSFSSNNNNNTTNSSTNLEMSRRSSNCSDSAPPQRRDSNCSDNCPCSRRISDYGQTESYRKTSHGSIGSLERRFSNGSIQFERTMSNASDVSIPNANMFPRRMSNDFNYDRKQSIETQTQADLPYDNDGNVGGGGGGWNVFPRRYSNNFTASNKMAAYDNAQYINGRRISTDSGYDRRYSFGSEYEGSPRSRTGSFLNNYKHASFDLDGQPRSRTGSFLDGSPRSRSGSFAQRNAETLVRTPIGPDGSKGFGSRTRKFGQTVSPV